MSDDPQLGSAYSDSASGSRSSDRPRRGCLSRIAGLIWSLFLILLSVALSVLVIGGFIYFILNGTVPQTPGQFVSVPNELRRLRDENTTFRQEVQTQSADLAVRESNNSEIISALEQEVNELQELGDDLREQASLSATIQAQASDDRETMAEIQTAQVEQEEQFANFEASLEELQQRTDRVARFLQRLGEIAGEASEELGPGETTNGSAEEDETAGPPPATSTVTPTTAVTATPTATDTPETTATPTATEAPAATPTEEATATSVVTPTVEGEDTDTTTPEADTPEAAAETPTGAEAEAQPADATPVPEVEGEPSPAGSPTPVAEEAAAPPEGAAAEETPTTEATPEGELRTYVVQPGDTLREIAEQFDTTVQELIEANNLTLEQADSLQIGQELIIP